MAHLFRLARPMTLLIYLGPTPSEAVIQSDSQQEWEETELKASRLVKIAAGQRG